MESIRNKQKVRWAELLPDEFLERQSQFPVVYLPLGLCEPHGHIAAFGLDTIKADYICEAAARRVGGIVAPTQAYHIHETGYHAPWLEEVLGEATPYMTGIPPEILLHLFLYQLRSFHNAGFRGVVVLSGHAGGNQEDLRLAAAAFMEISPMKVEVRADPELVEGKYVGDHAGKYEISQLMYIRPELIDMTKISRQKEDPVLGRFALGPDAAEATPELGEEIMRSCVEKTCELAEGLLAPDTSSELIPLDFVQVEEVWTKVKAGRNSWSTYNLHEGQSPAGAASRWKKHEKPSNP